MQKKGFIQVYTGDGKGKTTAAVGLSVRAISHGLKVGWVSFHKDPVKTKSGEVEVLKNLGVDVFSFCKTSRVFDKRVPEMKMHEECLAGLEHVQNMILSGKYDLIVLDEINVSLQCGYLTFTEVKTVLDSRPADLELILTGQGAPAALIRMADLVSRMSKIKHPYDKGIKARKGVDY